MRRLPQQVTAEAKIETLGQTLNGAIDALADVAALLNERSEKLRMYHKGISHRVLETRRVDAETQKISALVATHELNIAAQDGCDSALRQGVNNLADELSAREAALKNVIEANDTEIKATMAKLAAQHAHLVTAAQALGTDQAFTKHVVLQTGEAIGGHLAQSAAN